MEISFPAVAWRPVAPYLILTGTALLVILLDLVPPHRRKHHLGVVALFGVVAALMVSVFLWGQSGRAFRNMVVLDNFALFFDLIFGYSAALVILLSLDSLRRRGAELAEYYILVLFAAGGMILMASGNDLLIIFLGLEQMSISLYVLAGFFRTELRSSESAMKYFLLGAFATGFFLYGIALIYGATGTTNLDGIAQTLQQTPLGRDPLLLIGAALLLVGFGFKISSVPFHMWVPDVYEGAPTPITALIATGSKAAAFAALLRVLYAPMRGLQPDWVVLFWGLAALTMTLGNVVAIAQSNLKRMLAYSSIAHAGYMLVGVVAGGAFGTASVLFYLLVYTFTTVGAFGVILLLERSGEEAVDIRDYSGLGFRHPVLALTLSFFLLSLIGVPPTAGFVGKVYLFGAAVRSGYVWLAVIAVVNSAVAAYYYLRLIVYMYMREPEGVETRYAPSFAGALALGIALWTVFQFGLAPSALFDLAQGAVAPLIR
ncbi:MAG TPA: NADH-quinone oxidoreductase subunit N [Methylomirabilota bacterium]|nr:NADH-quinone oxidoreductase subunit N [Methylomirabilota bacterium]